MIMNNVIDFGSAYLNKEIETVLKNNNNNGYARLIAIVNVMKEQGSSDVEIATAIKDFK